MSISELDTEKGFPQVLSSEPDLKAVRLLPEPAGPAVASPAAGRRHRITDFEHSLVLVCADFVSTCVALPIALVLLATMSAVPTNSLHFFWENLVRDALFPVAAVIAMAAGGPYRTSRSQLGPSTFKELQELVFAVGTGCVITLAVGALLHASTGVIEPGASQLVVAVVVAVLFVALGRVVVRALLHTLTVTRVLIVGSGSLTDRITTYLGLRRGVEIIGHVSGAGRPEAGALGTVYDLPVLCRDLDIDQLIVGFPSCHSEEFVATFRQLQSHVHIAFVPRYFELVSFRSRLADLSGLPLLEVARSDLSSLDRLVKRSFDIVASLAAIIALSPIFVAAAVAIRLSSPGRPLFRQTRMGRGGEPFTLLKFRTMTVASTPASDPEPAMPFEKSPGISRPLYEVRKKLSEEQRITRAGRFLRKSGLDELPQLINVLRGDMSIVGPRPFVPEESELEGWAARRFDMRPGITGLWQVSGRNELSTEDLHHLDHLYVTSWSFWWDLKIMMDTPRTMVSGT
ncbi:MAG: sugar transferase, partial [Acidimicrobiales bacterium]